MKRVLSIVLALSLIAGLMTGLTLTATAETDDYGNTVIESIAITDVTAPVAGAMPTAPGSIIASNDYAGFKIIDASWEYYDYTAHSWMWHDPSTAFAANTVYRIFFNVTTKSGYSFGYELEGGNGNVTVDGTPVSYASFWGDGAEYHNAGHMGLVYLTDGIQLIDSISLTGMPAMEVGSSTDTSTIAAPDGANYVITYASWDAWDNNYNRLYPIGDTLAEGYYYTLYVDLAPKAGYWFADTVTINDTTARCHSTDWGSECYVYYECDLLPTVREVRLTGLTAPVVGQTASASDIQVPADAKYDIRVEYVPLGGGATDSVTFDYDYYDLNITITPKDGYTFEMDSSNVYINDLSIYELADAYDWWVGGRHSSPDEIYINLFTEVEPPKGYINEFRLKGGVEEIEAGQTITTPTITYLPYDGMEDALTVIKTEWVDKDYNAVTGKFEDGKMYYLAVTVEAGEGYGFGSGLYYTPLFDSAENYVNETNNFDWSRETVTAYFPYSLLPTIDEVNLIVTAPVIGGTPGAVTLPSGAKYTLDANEEENWPGYDWYSDGAGDFDTFENGQKYYLDVYLKVADGYEFSEDCVVTINGVEIDNWYGNGMHLSIHQSYSFLKVIDKVDITVPEYKVGDVFKPEDITVANGVNYQLGYVGMSSNYTDPYTAIGKDRYHLNMEVYPNDGYEFSEDCVVTINGKKPTHVYGDTNWQSARLEFSFCEQINKVELPAFPTVAVGDTVTNGPLTAPDGAHYALLGQWVTGDMDYFDGAFANNSAYYYQIIAQPDAGYEFAEDCVVTIGGQEAKLQLMQVDYDGVYAIKLYNFGLKVIDTIELTIDAPVAGQKPGKVTVPDDANYTTSGGGWYMSKDGSTDNMDFMGQNKTFAYGNYYYVACGFEAEEGYIFSDNVKIVINGKQIEVKVDEHGAYAIANWGQAFHSFGLLEDTYSDNPKTGITGIGVLTAMMALSATAAGVIISKKKEF